MNETSTFESVEQGDLDGRCRRLELALRDRDELLARLDHDLRNRLGTLSVAADVLEAMPPGSAAAGEAREVIARQARILTARLNEWLPQLDRERLRARP
ncbi:hypothetical protein [Ramlibacter humi]|uniref:Signal transduction histidine kinase dimerisation/phosphoacceptor domain-containing protein n=1 Tax=Ramlibacter humi TaxID=2530451 RepID=A0A4Z0BEE6_9BURK|nr:hypothetical protein [Ramlibacter humi]TFY97682.1 hypothetical protein EZ216_18325 [Ramlibacter humi]